MEIETERVGGIGNQTEEDMKGTFTSQGNLFVRLVM